METVETPTISVENEQECPQEFSDTATEETDTSTPSDELESLKEEIERLNNELTKSRANAERLTAEISDFYSLFPDADISSLPDSVKQSMNAGNSLTAAYALYHRRLQLKKEQTEAINKRNASLSSGQAGKSSANEYFTPDEVRAMSQGEVKRNYTKIIESMKKWN